MSIQESLMHVAASWLATRRSDTIEYEDETNMTIGSEFESRPRALD